jgi:hypothetical protein
LVTNLKKGANLIQPQTFLCIFTKLNFLVKKLLKIKGVSLAELVACWLLDLMVPGSNSSEENYKFSAIFESQSLKFA